MTIDMIAADRRTPRYGNHSRMTRQAPGLKRVVMTYFKAVRRCSARVWNARADKTLPKLSEEFLATLLERR